MNYCILDQKNSIQNIIVCGSDEAAAEFGAVPSYEGARIGDPYVPPVAPAPAPTLEERITKLEQAIERGLSL